MNAESWLLEQESPPRLILALRDLAQVAHLPDPDQVGPDGGRGVKGYIIHLHLHLGRGWRRGRRRRNWWRRGLATGEEEQSHDDCRSDRTT